MPPRSAQTALPLPRGWRKITRAGVLHAISIAATAMPRASSIAAAKLAAFVTVVPQVLQCTMRIPMQRA